MDFIKLYISGLHANALSTHILVVLKNFVTGKEPEQISSEQMITLENLDYAFQKLKVLTEALDDETPQEIHFTFPEAEALILGFTDEAYTALTEEDPFYQDHSFAEYFGQIYGRYLEGISAGYVSGYEECRGSGPGGPH